MALADNVHPVRLPVDGGDLAALRADVTDRPPGRAVLLVPGFTGSKEDFLELLPRLAAAGHPAWAIDLRGQHESGGPDVADAYTVPTLAAEVAQVLAGLAATTDDVPHLVGHSFGGLVSRRALLDGGTARSLTLLGSGPAAIPSPRRDWIELMKPVLADGGLQALWDAAQSLADPAEEAAPEDVREFLRRRFFNHNEVALRVMGEQLLSEADHTDALRELGLPVLVAHGADDNAWHPPIQQEMAERLGARYAVVDGSLHSPAAEQPDVTATLLTTFWAGVEAGG